MKALTLKLYHYRTRESKKKKPETLYFIEVAPVFEYNFKVWQKTKTEPLPKLSGF